MRRGSYACMGSATLNGTPSLIVGGRALIRGGSRRRTSRAKSGFSLLQLSLIFVSIIIRGCFLVRVLSRS